MFRLRTDKLRHWPRIPLEEAATPAAIQPSISAPPPESDPSFTPAPPSDRSAA